jgi:beta-mannanase
VADLAAITANGSIPLLDWGCADNGTQVASGADDEQITAYAQALKAFGKPVFLRWCWEMNLVESHPEVGGPSGFVTAWVHIWTLFHQVGATNVSFVWCPALTGVDPAPYYPGNPYVDWIGVDGYDRSGTSTFADIFSAFYQQWAGHGKPMMVAETGSASADQADYLQSVGSGMPTLPQFKAIVYFDAGGPAANWQLQGSGLAAFGVLARDPYFNPT